MTKMTLMNGVSGMITKTSIIGITMITGMTVMTLNFDD